MWLWRKFCSIGDNYVKLFKSVTAHEPTKKGTSLGRKPITSTMNKNKRRSFKPIEDKEKTNVRI